MQMSKKKRPVIARACAGGSALARALEGPSTPAGNGNLDFAKVIRENLFNVNAFVGFRAAGNAERHMPARGAARSS